MSSIFQLYRDLFRRRPVMFVVSLIITTVVYAYVLAKFGIIKTGIFSKPTIVIQLEPTETYNVGVSVFALKRVRLVANSNEAIEKIKTAELLQLIRRLTPATGAVFNLYVIEGYNHKEIAQLLNISEGTSKWHLSEARKSLRQMIQQQHKKHS